MHQFLTDWLCELVLKSLFMVMKRIVTILLVLLALPVVAQRLSEEEVRGRVLDALRSLSVEGKMRLDRDGGVDDADDDGLLTKVYRQDDGECAVYEVSGGGFVIAGVDRRVPALLGYSAEGAFEGAMRNAAFRELLEVYSDIDPSAEKAPVMRRAGLPDAVAPLLNDTWHQYEPFWQQTPVVDGKQCLTGCVAHAMAEVMYYYRYPVRGAGSYTYNDSTGCGQVLTANFGEHVYDWDNILDSYVDGQYSQVQADAVALLLSDCGIAVDMKYSPEASGAQPVSQPIALANFFGYDRGMQMYFRDFYTWREWNDMLMGELAEGRPVLMSGYSAGQAHAYVCDGYDAQGLYHLNWGWEGEANGYYNIQYMSPDLPLWFDKNSAEQGLNLLQLICVGVRPAVSETDPSEEVHAFAMSKISALDAAAGRSGMVRVATYDVSNVGWNMHYGRVALVLKNDEGVVSVLKDYEHEFLLEEVDDTAYADTLSLTVPASVAEGTYRLVPMFLEDDGGWKEVRASVGTPNYLKVTVDEDSVSLAEPVEAMTNLSLVELDFPDTLVMQSTPNYSFSVRNDGAEFCGRLYMCLEAVNDPERMVVFNQQGLTLLPGETAVREFKRTYFNAAEGLYRLKIYHDVNLFNDTLCVLSDIPERFVRVVSQKTVGMDSPVLTLNEELRVYNTAGLLLNTVTGVSIDDAQNMIAAMDVPKGVYVVRCGKESRKIVKTR